MRHARLACRPPRLDSGALRRRLADTEDRLDALSSAAAENEAFRLRQSRAVQALEADAAAARARVRELEVLTEKQTSMLQAHSQSGSQLEETIRQLQQVIADSLFELFLSSHRLVQSLREGEARASAASRAASESAASLLLETDHRQKLEAAIGIKDRQISSLMALNARCKTRVIAALSSP